jgi:hypothetical protein
MFLCGLLVKGFHLSIDNLECAPRAFAEAGPEAVAVFLRHQPSLAVHKLNGSLGAGRDAEAAAVAFFRIDLDDLPYTFHDLLL